MAQENGCICQVCADLGFDCTLIAADGEDECTECQLGIHEDEREDD